ncbi:(2Fe-2S)-binding protein [Marinospirillum alkaliphilum]|uniref:Bacterioferritin-associated ferredoxin n=1 Tax=Marinospirillum alkaliphilum DSM 21637 TaxID=1122209 RepID=A0A1K1VKU3_9GAMM|nr:(2Fe-2S)-binding protein [Marinospirillum alkaliphilum]SFX25427.1 bacterioferritin-associated ferredoxin [Marinospirillum alkaliphilum DSM 21637]
MYVCICKGITEQQIRSSVAQGASTMRDLYRQLEVGSQCGKCVCTARQVLSSSQIECPSYDATAVA